MNLSYKALTVGREPQIQATLAAQLRPSSRDLLYYYIALFISNLMGDTKAVHVNSLIVCMSEPEISSRSPTQALVVICPSDAPVNLAPHHILAGIFINNHLV
jgi:hypothetical protein